MKSVFTQKHLLNKGLNNLVISDYIKDSYDLKLIMQTKNLNSLKILRSLYIIQININLALFFIIS